jgi:hypothetical protein
MKKYIQIELNISDNYARNNDEAEAISHAVACGIKGYLNENYGTNIKCEVKPLDS